MSGITKYFRGGDDKVPPASDGGLAKAVGQVLNKPSEAPVEMKVIVTALPWDHKPWGPKLSEHLRRLIRDTGMCDMIPIDAHLFTYQFEKLPRAARIEFWAHFWAKLAYYECSYDPACNSVDVGHQDDKDSWSVGMLQMSVCDQPNYGVRLGYNFADLQDPFKNLNLAMPIAANLLKKWGRICGRKSEDSWYGLARYWGTLRDNSAHVNYSYKPMIKYMQSLQLAEYPMPTEAKDGAAVALKIGVIVGHEKIAPGARMCAPYGSVFEYEYNSEIADLMHKYAHTLLGVELEIFTRDQIGISGAYRRVQAAKCDVVMELHFNSYNGAVEGSEVLCSSEQSDQALAAQIQAGLVELFGREKSGNRGVKITDEGRGAQSCTSYPGKANCLIEPGFGDNMHDAKMLMEKKEQYAKMLVDRAVKYFRSK
jgi:N-acetylmuramoyl-L-alanine amidase